MFDIARFTLNTSLNAKLKALRQFQYLLEILRKLLFCVKAGYAGYLNNVNTHPQLYKKPWTIIQLYECRSTTEKWTFQLHNREIIFIFQTSVYISLQQFSLVQLDDSQM